MPRFPTSTGLLLAGALLVSQLALPAGRTWAQDPAGGAGGAEIRGRVVDAETGTPLERVVVQLRRRTTGAEEWRTARSTISDGAGEYRFDRLEPGEYRLEASSIGYRSFAVEVLLDAASRRQLSVGLTIEPVLLPALAARVPPSQPLLPGSREEEAPEAARWEAGGGFAGRAALSLDATELTYRDLLAGAAAEPDIFRALQRHPAVSTRNDFTAELWIRGAPWQHTRVFLDGIPLFNPLQGIGTLSGVGASAIGAAAFHPGVRPASMGEGAAGVVDLRTRRGRAGNRPNAQLDLSLVTTGISADGELADGRLGWMVAGRRSYLDWLTRLTSELASGSGEHIPYSFQNLAGRIDLRPGAGHELGISGMRGRDQLENAGAPANWGNTLLRLSHAVPAGEFWLRHTLGGSANHGRFPELEDARLPVYGSPAETRVAYATLRGELVSSAGLRGLPVLSAGYELVRQRASYHGPDPLPIPRPVYSLSGGGTEAGGGSPPATADLETSGSELRLAGAWVDHVRALGALDLQAGARLEASGRIAGSGPVRVAPRLAVRLSPVPAAALSAGLSRTWQYAQAVAPTGVHLASLSSSYAWVLAGPEVPALRADLASAGVRLGSAESTSLAAHTFVRRTTGILIHDPLPGPLVGRGYVRAESAAQGIELSADAKASRWSGRAAWTHSRVVTSAAGVRYPAAADRPHRVVVSSSVHPGSRWSATAVLTGASGIPYTRVYGADLWCEAGESCGPGPIPWRGEPNAARSPRYASLDLSARHRTRALGANLDVYGQLLNALDRTNETHYADVFRSCGGAPCESLERVERGVPRLLVAGASIRW